LWRRLSSLRVGATLQSPVPKDTGLESPVNRQTESLPYKPRHEQRAIHYFARQLFETA